MTLQHQCRHIFSVSFFWLVSTLGGWLWNTHKARLSLPPLSLEENSSAGTTCWLVWHSLFSISSVKIMQICFLLSGPCHSQKAFRTYNSICSSIFCFIHLLFHFWSINMFSTSALFILEYQLAGYLILRRNKILSMVAFVLHGHGTCPMYMHVCTHGCMDVDYYKLYNLCWDSWRCIGSRNLEK